MKRELVYRIFTGLLLVAVFIISLFALKDNSPEDLPADPSAGKSETGVNVAKSVNDSLRISEICSDNKCVYTQNGYCDYIELENLTGENLNISGVGLSDNPEEPKQLLPAGTMLKPYECLLLCAGDGGSLEFSLKNGESVCLFDVNGTLIQQISVIEVAKDAVIASDTGGNYYECNDPTPGFSNNSAGREAYLLSAQGNLNIILSEVCTDSVLTGTKQGGTWIELQNTDVAKLNGIELWLTDDPTDPDKCAVSIDSIAAGGFYVVEPTEFSLRTGETIYLFQNDGRLLDSFTVIDSGRDVTQNSTGLLETATPGFANNSEGRKAYMKSVSRSLIISEVMAYNTAYLRGPYGKTHDYIELKNVSSEAVNLSEYTISDTMRGIGYELGDSVLQPGEVILFTAELNASNTPKDIAVLPFGISQDGETLVLWHMGEICDYIEIPALKENEAFGRNGDMEAVVLEEPSPGE